MRSRFSRYLVILYDAGYTAESAASRCVESLFLPNRDVPCARLTDYLRGEYDLRGAALNGDCERVLQRCIYFSVQQNIPELLGEFDPQYRKILRMVLESIAKDTAYTRHKGFFDDMVSRVEESRIQLHLPAMPADEIVARLSRRASPDDSTHVLLSRIFDILDENPDVRRIIQTSQLVTVLRDFFHLYWTFDSEDEERGIEELFENGDIERLIIPILEEISAGIIQSYVNRGVIEQEEADRLATAVHTMLKDLATATAAPWFEYHAQQFPDISYEVYRETYRGRFEYVLGSAKELFVMRCQKYFRADFSANR
ncbi:MAG: hypothetical protein IH600_02320 [Bacteroidetes bacterium]|nr:hypothetical protein [Bacteroidota bacterium]